MLSVKYSLFLTLLMQFGIIFSMNIDFKDIESITRQPSEQGGYIYRIRTPKNNQFIYRNEQGKPKVKISDRNLNIIGDFFTDEASFAEVVNLYAKRRGE